jgi:hypothetical protein
MDCIGRMVMRPSERVNSHCNGTARRVFSFTLVGFIDWSGENSVSGALVFPRVRVE